MKHKVQYNAKKSYYLECLVCGRAFSGTVPYEYQPVLFRFDSAVGVWELAGSSGRNWAAAGSFQNVLTLTASQICKADSKIFKACLYDITIAMLLIDPLYLSIWLRWISGAGRGKKRRRDGRLHRLIPLSRLLEAGHLHRRGKLRLLHRHGDKSRRCGPLWPELRLGGM